MATAPSSDKKYDPIYASQSTSGDEEELVVGRHGEIDKQSLIQSKQHSSSGIETAPLRDASFHQETIFGFDGLKVIVVSALIFAVAILIALIVTIIIGDPQVTPHGAVSSSNADCSDIGKHILQDKGGSAVDAALAAIICLGVVHGHASGLGGGGFMLVRDYKADDIIAYDFRETAPGNSNATMYAGRFNASVIGGLAVAVPGELRGIQKAHEQYGKVSWKELFQGSIKLARDGFTCSGSLAEKIGKLAVDDMSNNMKAVYAPGGVKKIEGDIIKRPTLAALLERIAENRVDGVNLFYKGDVGKEIVQAVTAGAGIMAESDLGNYQVKTPPFISIDYHGYQISSLPAPSGGAFILSAMNIMEGYNVSESDKGSLEYLHRLVETFKFTTAMGSHLGDPAFNNDVQNVTTEMLSKFRASSIRSAITDVTHDPSYYFNNSLNGAAAPQQSYGTSHVSVIDNDNNMVSITSTINKPFGSLIMTDSGIILNNEMGDFEWQGKSAEPIGDSEVNFIAPAKRPQSLMAPVIAWNKTNVCSRKMAIGGTNGSRIWTGVTQVLLNLLSLRDSLTDSIEPMTRLHHPLIPNQIEAEDALYKNTTLISGLEGKGHKVVAASQGLSSVHVAMKESDVLYAVSDNRTAGSGSAIF